MEWRCGIDTCAHEGALKVGGITVAVLGSGFNHIYPKENIKLLDKIIQCGGAVITEYEPDTPPDSRNFPVRNRIVSGLSKAVLVVEAVYRSGTSITANLAKEQGREVFCIPSNLGRKNGVGTNNLIKEGAKIVTHVDDILEYLQIEKCTTMQPQINIPQEYQPIYECIEDEPTHIDFICKKLNVDIGSINANLMLMELEGYIKSLPGNYYKKVVE